jgi:inorganic pyrophosphatase
MAYKDYPVLHPWHSLDIGEKPPELLNGIIEISAGSRVKYEIDKKSGLIYVDRILFSPCFYPQNYGFIPQSYCDDGDPLDVIIFSQEPLVPRCIAPCRVIGALEMIDGDEMDDKIIAVLEADPYYKTIQNVSDLPPAKIEELREFFTIYKRLEKKPVTVKDILNKEAALKIVKASLDMYEENREKLQIQK